MNRLHHVRTLTPEQWADEKRAQVGFFRKLDPCRCRFGLNDAPNAALATARLLGIPVGVIVYSSAESDQVAS